MFLQLGTLARPTRQPEYAQRQKPKPLISHANNEELQISAGPNRPEEAAAAAATCCC
jgi:hypothetical protein